jgi:opacity protein-like surface antigen
MYHFIRRYTRSLALVLFLGAGLIFTATPAQSQTDISPGVRAGVDFMSVGGDDTDGFDSRTGFLIGGYATIDFGAPVLVQPEIMYIQKGASAEIGDTEITQKLDYIEIPVLAKYQIPAGGFSPNVFAGPALGFNINAERSNGDTQDISDSISGTEFGLYFGAGADFGLSAGTVSIDARYNLGLTNILDTDGDASQNNQGFMITAGFAF